MITILQMLGLTFVTFAMSRAILRAKDRSISPAELVFWMSIWSGMIIVVFFPDFISRVAMIIGVDRGIDVIVYTSITLLFYLIFRLYVKLETVQSEVTKLVRFIAINEKKRK